MSCYISSNNNRFYVSKETSFAQAATISDANRIPAVKLTAKQVTMRAERKDKTGSRSYAGVPAGARKSTSFGLTTYLTGWDDQTSAPACGPFFEASMGKAVQTWTGGTVAAAPNAVEISFTAPHGLQAGQAIAFGGEIRFVTAIVNTTNVLVNAPFSIQPSAGTILGATATYRLATDLPSVTIYDYWDPADAVQRLLSGAAVDQMSLKVNGDFHEFKFTGEAADVIDSASFTAGQAGLAGYPAEPVVLPLIYDIIPGHLGQAWFGATAERFYTLTEADIKLDNDLDLRANEFGSDRPRCVSAGQRKVTLNVSLYEQRNAATRGLYEAARSRTPIPVMFQLGQQPGQLLGVYMKRVVPEVPEFDDSDPRLQWALSNCQAQGAADDELIVAFG